MKEDSLKILANVTENKPTEELLNQFADTLQIFVHAVCQGYFLNVRNEAAKILTRLVEKQDKELGSFLCTQMTTWWREQFTSGQNLSGKLLGIFNELVQCDSESCITLVFKALLPIVDSNIDVSSCTTLNDTVKQIMTVNCDNTNYVSGIILKIEL